MTCGGQSLADPSGPLNADETPPTVSPLANPAEVDPPAVSPTPVTLGFQNDNPILANLPNGKFCLELCAGSHHPITTALQHMGLSALPVDSLISPDHNILNDPSYEGVLRIAASGQIAYAAAAPSCGEFSLLKPIPPGPLPIRTMEHPLGIPNPTPDQQRRLDQSRMLLVRCVTILRVAVAAGAHGHLEQLRGALSWLDPDVKHWVQAHGHQLIAVAACSQGLMLEKCWLFSTTFDPLVEMASSCNHPEPHQSIVGVKDNQGEYLSRQSAEYPPSLCNKIAQLIRPLLDSGPKLTLPDALNAIPIKSLQQPPHAINDGGGYVSSPDWSTPQCTSNPFRDLRKNWIDLILKNKLHTCLINSLQESSPNPPFTALQLRPFLESFEDFCKQHGAPNVDWSIPEGQPFCLHALKLMASIIHDPDTALFQHLLDGVPTGFQKDIPCSHVFTTIDPSDDDTVADLSSHWTNWSSAEDNDDVVSSLLQEEIHQGWVAKFPGSHEQAKAHWPLGTAIGKLSIAFSDSRPPRLVMDPSISGTNAACWVPEKQSMPMPTDVIRSFPLRNCSESQSAFGLDIKSAHKRVRVRKQEQGLLLFQYKGHLYHYTVCPFGAKFSQHWWGRVGSLLVRILHHLLFLKHCLFLFVDDFLLTTPRSVIAIQASLMVVFCQLFQVPVSWRKCSLHHHQTWIGWQFDFHAGVVSLHPSKKSKLLQLIQSLLSHQRISKKRLEKFLGLALWCTSLFPALRAQLHTLYSDLAKAPATLYSCDPKNWISLQQCLSSNLIFERVPQHTSIPINSKIISVRHHNVNTLDELSQVPITERRIWMRAQDPNSQHRRLSQDSIDVLSMLSMWLQSCQWLVPMRPKPRWPGLSFADAFAEQDLCGIGGYIQLPNSPPIWFSERFTSKDFDSIGLDLGRDLQKHIGFLEALAQLANLHLLTRSHSNHRVNLNFTTNTDNTSAEARLNNLFSTKYPMNKLCTRVSFLLAKHNIILDAQHVPGEYNDLADALNFWRGQVNDPLPAQVSPTDRVRFSLQHLWQFQSHPNTHPSNLRLHWFPY